MAMVAEIVGTAEMAFKTALKTKEAVKIPQDHVRSVLIAIKADLSTAL